MINPFSFWIVGKRVKKESEKYENAGPYERQKILWKNIVIIVLAIITAAIVIKAKS